MLKIVRASCMCLWFLLVTIALCGCFLHIETEDPKDIAFEKEWGYDATVRKGAVIHNEETAIAIATAYMETLYDSSTSYGEYHYSSVEFKEDKAAWIVSFLPENGDESAVCNIFLNRDDGAVLAIAWGKYTG